MASRPENTDTEGVEIPSHADSIRAETDASQANALDQGAATNIRTAASGSVSAKSKVSLNGTGFAPPASRSTDIAGRQWRSIAESNCKTERTYVVSGKKHTC